MEGVKFLFLQTVCVFGAQQNNGENEDQEGIEAVLAD